MTSDMTLTTWRGEMDYARGARSVEDPQRRLTLTIAEQARRLMSDRVRDRNVSDKLNASIAWTSAARTTLGPGQGVGAPRRGEEKGRTQASGRAPRCSPKAWAKGCPV